MSQKKYRMKMKAVNEWLKKIRMRGNRKFGSMGDIG